MKNQTTKPDDLKSLPLEELKKQHEELYRTFMPTLQHYTELASQCLALQKEMFDRLVRESFTQANRLEVARICSFSARETPGHVEGVLKRLTEETAIQVALVIFDPLTSEYHLFGSKE